MCFCGGCAGSPRQLAPSGPCTWVLSAGTVLGSRIPRLEKKASTGVGIRKLALSLWDRKSPRGTPEHGDFQISPEDHTQGVSQIPW